MADGGTVLPRSIGFLLLPGFSMLALFSALEPLRLANQLLGHRHYGWRILTVDGSPARASCGMCFPADNRAGDAAGQPEPGCLFVVAGFDPWPQPDQRLRNWLRSLSRRGVVLGAIDTGAFLLAAADLLASARTAVHWESADALQEMFPDLIISEAPYEIGERLLLCAGGTAVLEMMIVLLEQTHGAVLATGIADRLMHGRKGFAGPAASRPGQHAEGLDPEVSRAIEVMSSRTESVASIAELARAAGVSKRTLERKFRQALGQTPTEAYLERRLEHARGLLRNTDMPVREVALASGFSSLSYFCRAYKQRFRRSPGGDRRLDYSLVGESAALSRDPAILAGAGIPSSG